MNIDDFIKLFSSKSAKILILLAFLGVVITLKPMQNSLYLNYNIEKKIELVKKWKEVSNQELSGDKMARLKTEVEKAIGNENELVSKLSYSPPETFIFKFIAGGFLFLLVYGLNLMLVKIACKQNYDLVGVKIFLRNRHILYMWLCLSIVNMLIPYISFEINYVFIPSCLTILSAGIMLVWYDAKQLVASSCRKKRDI